MRYSGIQPQFFPRLHYFARLVNTDIFMLRDDCQFVRDHKYPDGKRGKSYQAHTPIRYEGGLKLLPVSVSRVELEPIYQTKVTYDPDWVKDHLNIIKRAYFKSPNFKTIFEDITNILEKRITNLSDLNILTLLWALSHLLGSPTSDLEKLSIEYINGILKENKEFRIKKIIKATETKSFEKLEGLSPNEKIIMLCNELGITEDFCGGTAVSAYVDKKIFEDSNIKITVQDWKCQEYPQQFMKTNSFIPNLSIIDLLMNVPKDTAVKIIKG